MSIQDVSVDAELEELLAVAGGEEPKVGGPLVVVVGLHGGAGTSTLAYALAHHAAAENPRVLLVETPGAAGDQAALVGVSPLWELGVDVRLGEIGKPTVAETSDVIAVRKAVYTYGPTVIDVGTLRGYGARELLRDATHVVWVTQARPGAADRARVQLRSVPSRGARQALVVRGASGKRGPAGELRRLAEGFCDRLIYMSDSPGPEPHQALVERRMLATLTALTGFIEETDT